ncbi:transmembrane protein, putative (macronuclear) [Tetrahymena thermophila SB210]|uniref:Transmembrane protein, putative n=1 Tax=Tetrahymena thermophila (strain SB210) TaxID=312017 RepID=W7XH17_TETTS|nr:transmembrane protein, putative [Tetrahymena thermophila SB210]EWS72294.1 transmembrane protein, putative [Tetrahymena thermophila SB210]|eukprot:XP_012655234.1 transmembrane protein, putative [Tetrahymena thermophila SB210]
MNKLKIEVLRRNKINKQQKQFALIQLFQFERLFYINIKEIDSNFIIILLMTNLYKKYKNRFVIVIYNQYICQNNLFRLNYKNLKKQMQFLTLLQLLYKLIRVFIPFNFVKNLLTLIYYSKNQGVFNLAKESINQSIKYISNNNNQPRSLFDIKNLKSTNIDIGYFMQQQAKKDSIYSYKHELDQNFENLLQENFKHKTPSEYWLYTVYHIMIILIIASSKENEVIDLIIGIIFLVVYIFLNFMLQKHSSKNSIKYNIVFLILFIVICVLTYNTFTLLKMFITSSSENSFKVVLQIAFHSYITAIFSGLAPQFRSIGRLDLYYLSVLVANFIYIAIIIYQKYSQQIDVSIQNCVLDVLAGLSNLFLNYCLYFNQTYNLNFSKFLSYQKDLNEQKFKKLEFFIASLDNQEIILVKHKQSDANQSKQILDNELINANQNAKEHLNQMQRVFFNIQNYETEEDKKKFIDILQNKSRREIQKNPKMFTFKLKQGFQESFSANFISFQDFQARYKNNQIDLDKSVNYYAIQIVQNDRLFLKISRKFIILQYFINIIRNFAKGDPQRIKIINVYEDYCHIIQNELDLYRILTYPKEKIIETSYDDEQQNNQQIKYTVQLIEKNMTTFFQLYKEQKKLKDHFLSINFQKNSILTKEIYLTSIHIIINTIISFINYYQKINVEFKEETQKLRLTISIQKSDEHNVNDQILNNNNKSIEESFENIINKVKKVKNSENEQYNYSKQSQKNNLIYNFYITIQSKKDQNSNSIIENNLINNISNQDSSFLFKNSKYPSSQNQSDGKQQQRQNEQFHRKNQKDYTFAEVQPTNQTYLNLI